MSSPSDEMLNAAKRRRDEILATGRWLTAAEVWANEPDAPMDMPPGAYARRLRRARELFGVRRRQVSLHPEFQFDSSGRRRPLLHELLVELPYEANGWTVAFWLFQPSLALAKQSPAEAFPHEPERVVAHARAMFRAEDW